MWTNARVSPATSISFLITASSPSKNAFCFGKNCCGGTCLRPHHPPLPQKEVRPATLRPIDGRSNRKGLSLVLLHPPKRSCRGQQVQVDDLSAAAWAAEHETPFVAFCAHPIGNPATDAAFFRHLFHAFQGVATEVPGEPRVDTPGKSFP